MASISKNKPDLKEEFITTHLYGFIKNLWKIKMDELQFYNANEQKKFIWNPVNAKESAWGKFKDIKHTEKDKYEQHG